MIYLAAGYAVFWIVSFAFIYSLVSRQGQIQQELRVLEQVLQADQEQEQ